MTIKKMAVGITLLGIVSYFFISCGDDKSAKPISRDYSLKEEVEIIVDNTGIPHIYAKNDRDLFFASGYNLAAMDLFNVDVAVRRANGRQAEAIGENGLEWDKKVHLLGLPALVFEDAKLIEAEFPKVFKLIVSYTCGINRRIKEIIDGETALPSAFTEKGIYGNRNYSPQPYSVEDILAVARMITFGGNTFEFDILLHAMNKLAPNAEILPVLSPAGKTYITGISKRSSSPGGRGNAVIKESTSKFTEHERALLDKALDGYSFDLSPGGSNAFAISGKYTEKGTTLMGYDPHQPTQNPNIFSMQHLNSAHHGGDFDVLGWSFPGAPGIQVGANDKISWGCTTAFADIWDVWDVEINEEGALIGDKRIPVKTEIILIKVKQADGSMREEVLERKSIDGYGFIADELLPPEFKLLLLSNFKNSFLINWTGLAGTTEASIIIDWNRARSLDEFYEAHSRSVTVNYNVTASDKDGFITRTFLQVPVRNKGVKCNRILKGSEGGSFWTGAFLDGKLLPFVDGRNGKLDFTVTANNDPYGFTEDNDPFNDEFYYGSFFSPGYRARRFSQEINRMIASKSKITRDMAIKLDFDFHSPLAAELIPLLAGVSEIYFSDINGPNSNGFENIEGLIPDDLITAVDKLKAWKNSNNEYNVSPDSEEAALYRIWYAFLSKKILHPELGILFPQVVAQKSALIGSTVSLIYQDTDKYSVLFAEHSPEWMLVQSMIDALNYISTRTESPLTWGDIYYSEFRSPDRAGSYTYLVKYGDDSSINTSEGRMWDDKAEFLNDRLISRSNSAFRYVAEFDPSSGRPVLYYNYYYGNGGYTDSTEDWLNGVYKKIPSLRSEIDAVKDEKRSMILKPL